MEAYSEDSNKFITEENLKQIVENCGYTDKELSFKTYLKHASDKMLGFIADYWRLQIHVTNNKSGSRKVLHFFIKGASKSNEAKANMAKEYNLLEKEVLLYATIKKKLDINDLRPWSPKMIAIIDDDALVFEDLAALQYKLRNKFERFDKPHTLQALNTLSRFHASSIVYEEKKSKISGRSCFLYNEYSQLTRDLVYTKTNTWFLQCMNGALEAIRTYSKYKDNKEALTKIEKSWENIWFSALELTEISTKYRNVICHRDLWNNNLMFHYKQSGDCLEPDDCVLVDFQAFKCHPPTGDVMQLLYCNLDPVFRETHLNTFLNYYYKQLTVNLANHGIEINEILNKQDFLASAEEMTKWGLVSCACLIQLFWVDDELTTETFSDSEQFNQIMSENKGEFLKKMMSINEDYKNKVLGIFEEIVEKYCIPELAK
ncbi:uncharacterized protein LOC106132139 [Amyelois transitella]|uniref:uncharacterized protein LOC106132139 n=1 Tax=Amyelois transitella TaxID=680683 RepID=UPI00067D2313|nr:uncharacterized protein LOC106132139 [Amyelois transitella]